MSPKRFGSPTRSSTLINHLYSVSLEMIQRGLRKLKAVLNLMLFIPVHPGGSFMSIMSWYSQSILPGCPILISFSPELAELGKINGEQYFLPWDWGYESMLVRSDLVPEMPTAWADLWDPQYAGHVSVFDSSEAAYIVAALSLGIDPYNASDEDNQAIKQQLIDLKPNLLNYWVDYTELSQMLAQGDIWIGANAWSDSYAILLDEGYDVAYIQPEEGRIGWVCGFGIAADTDGENLDKAYAYINAALDTQSMLNFGNEYYYGVASQEATVLLDPYIINLMGLEDPVSALQNTVFNETITEEHRVIIENLWTEVKAEN